MPPEKIAVDKEVFDHQGAYELSTEFLSRFSKEAGKKGVHDVTYDI
jgi:hypothetical protein